MKNLATASNYNIRYAASSFADHLSRYNALSVGDVNGDGVDDLVMGASDDNNSFNYSGSVWIVFSTLIDDVGTSTGNNKSLATATNYNIRYDGVAASDYLTQGNTALSVGDVNGDGVDDVIMGDYFANTVGTDSGSAYVVFSTLIDDVGTSTGNVKALATATNYSVRYDGSAMISFQAYKLQLADVNGDSKKDLIVADPMADTNGVDSGAVWVIFGGRDTNGTQSLSVMTNYNIRYDGPTGNKITTYAFSDVNGDGLGDLIIGDRGADYGGNSSGSVYVLFSTLIDDVGTSTGNTKLTTTASNYNVRFDGPDATYWTLPVFVTTGDVNGDNSKDLLFSSGYSTSSKIFVIFSTLIDDVGTSTGNNKPLTTATNYNIRFDGGAASDVLGGSGGYDNKTNIGTGDVNGDGLGDLVLTATYADNNGDRSGSAWVMFSTLIDDVGTSTGNNKLLSTATNYNIRYDGAAAGSYMTQYAQIATGDVNGDGLGDLMLGGSTNSGGSVYIMFSTLIDDVGETTGNNKPFSTTSNYNICFTGASNTAIGKYGTILVDDVNGDGLGDLAIGTTGVFINKAYLVYSTLIDDVGTSTGNDKSFSTNTNYSIRYDGPTGGYIFSDGLLTTIGDFNGDGTNDFITGDDVFDLGGTDSGSIWVIYNNAESFKTKGFFKTKGTLKFRK